MNEGMISTRYARALLQYALEQKVEDEIFVEMEKISSTFVHEPRLRMAMDNPMVTAIDKQNLMEATVGGKASTELIRFVELVLKNKRDSHLQTMALSYQNLYCRLKNINRGKLITATPANKGVVDKLKTLFQELKSGTLELETAVDTTIGGGFVLYVDTYRYDASVASQLKRIKQKLVEESAKMA